MSNLDLNFIDMSPTNNSDNQMNLHPKIVLFNNIFPFDLSNEYKPGQDFYLHVNKKWLDSNKIPSEENRWGTFDVLREKSKKDVNSLLNEVCNCFNSKLFSKKSFFNIKPIIKVEEIELLKNLHLSSRNYSKNNYSEYLKNILLKLYSSKTKEELVSNVFENLTLNGLNGPVEFSAFPDMEDSDINILHLDYGGLGLPDKSYYFDNEKKDILDEYKKFMKKYLLLFRNDITDQNINDIFEFEKRLAYKSYSNVEKRDPNNLNNPTDYNNLISQFKFIGLNEFNKYISKQPFFKGKKLDKINVSNVRFLKEYENLFTNTNLNILIDYFIWIFLMQVGSYLNEDVCKTRFDFYGSVMGGTKKINERWERVVDLESNLLGDIISKIYVKVYFSEESKVKAYELVNLVKDKFKDRLIKNEWMSNKTKKNAVLKLDNMNLKMGYPDKFINYEIIYGKLDSKNSFLKNSLICKKFLFFEDIRYLYLPKDKDKWFMNAFEINAYYSPSYNEIVFPSGILQEPFFSKDYDLPLNLGGIGVVIGHEITHGFDDQGRKFDKKGDLENWYEEVDIIKFKEKTKVLRDQFSNFKLLNTYINGDLTLGENIADLGGVTIAVDILNDLMKNNNISEENQNKLLKKLFYNYAKIWRQNIRNKELKKRIQIDPHSPAVWRVNGILPNINEFYNVFGISEKDMLFIKEKNRAIIW